MPNNDNVVGTFLHQGDNGLQTARFFEDLGIKVILADQIASLIDGKTANFDRFKVRELDRTVVDDCYRESEGWIELARRIWEVHWRWLRWSIGWYIRQDAFDVDPEDVPFVKQVIARWFLREP